jgi:hypothetical protein
MPVIHRLAITALLAAGLALPAAAKDALKAPAFEPSVLPQVSDLSAPAFGGRLRDLVATLQRGDFGAGLLSTFPAERIVLGAKLPSAPGEASARSAGLAALPGAEGTQSPEGEGDPLAGGLFLAPELLPNGDVLIRRADRLPAPIPEGDLTAAQGKEGGLGPDAMPDGQASL